MDKPLQGKVIFVTGGSTGIGKACARAYVQSGARVAICAPEAADAEGAAAELGSDVLGLKCDVSVEDEVRAALEQILEQFGQLDGIHNNAGIASPSKAVHETTEAEWDRLFNVNIKGVYWTTRYGLEALKSTRGCILNTSSMVGSIGQEIHAAYSATKGAMNALTKSMALDYAPYGVRVNAVAPAGVWTPMLRQWAGEQPEPEKIERYLDKIHPLGYCPEGDVIADACVFLLSDAARFITGHILPVSGGAELGYRRVEE